MCNALSDIYQHVSTSSQFLLKSIFSADGPSLLFLYALEAVGTCGVFPSLLPYRLAAWLPNPSLPYDIVSSYLFGQETIMIA